jgi:putative component of membrane protein insertase Oxa1/YidC/SpoIIIJ protein YidD
VNAPRIHRLLATLLALGAATACTSGEKEGEDAGATAGSTAGQCAIGFYQRWLGDQWAFHCRFQPSCSNYGAQSIENYGLFAGSLMIADRLMRDHDLCYERYAADDFGRPLDPPADNALFNSQLLSGPHVDEAAARAADADAQELQHPPYAGDEQLAFADRLFEAHEWDRARIEYARLLFHEPATPHAVRCHQRIALCFAHLDRYHDALAAVDRLPAGPISDDTRALVLRELGAHDRALEQVDTRDAAGRLLAGFLALEAVRPDAARQQFEKLDAPLREPLLREVAKFEELPSKSRWLAGSLSAVVPGAGQLYAGRPEDALVAFITNGVLIGTTAYAWHRGERVTAGALGFVAFGFYAGNIYGGVNAAAKYDRNVQEDLLAKARGWLRRSNLWMSLAPNGDGGALGIYFGF